MKRRSLVSRRNLLQSLTVAAAGAGVGKARPVVPRPAGRPRVLALIGDRYHNPDYIRVSLDRVFGELNLPVYYTINYEEISGSLLSGYELFVCFRDGMIWPGGYLEPNGYSYSRQLENRGDWPKEEPQGWITEEQGRAIKEFVLAGGGFYALHNSSHISLYSRDFREVMGGAYVGHPPLRPFKVRVVNPDHPITRGVRDFVVNDEQHYVTYDKAPDNIVLKSENVDGLSYEDHGVSSVAGWAFDFGKGRVVFTAVGHTVHAMWNPEYLKIQRNAARWLLRIA
jgi:type 1 glutamine amidotransferase